MCPYFSLFLICTSSLRLQCLWGTLLERSISSCRPLSLEQLEPLLLEVLIHKGKWKKKRKEHQFWNFDNLLQWPVLYLGLVYHALTGFDIYLILSSCHKKLRIPPSKTLQGGFHVCPSKTSKLRIPPSKIHNRPIIVVVSSATYYHKLGLVFLLCVYFI